MIIAYINGIFLIYHLSTLYKINIFHNLVNILSFMLCYIIMEYEI